MSESRSIRVMDLILDESNPRLANPNSGQRETLRTLAGLMGRKLVNLCRDIQERGLDPSVLMIVSPVVETSQRGQEMPSRYVVLEGNRRLAAIRALENPDALAGVLQPRELTDLRQLSAEYVKEPVESATCAIVKSRDEARHWIALRHTGENDGLGVMKWGYDEQSRFSARSGKSALHTQVLDFLERNEAISTAERAAVPAASLQRVLSTPAIREKLGIDSQQGELVVKGRQDQVIKAITNLTGMLSSGEIKTKDIYTSNDRAELAKKLPLLVTHTAESAKPKPATKNKRTPARKQPRRVEHLIPNDCVLQITDPRCRDIENELRSLHVDDKPNAVAVLFRVFLELSLDCYCTKHQLAATEQSKLAYKMKIALDDILKRKLMPTAAAQPVRRAMQAGSIFAPSVTQMHEYVHSQFTFPAPGDLRAAWKSLQPYIAALWSI